MKGKWAGSARAALVASAVALVALATSAGCIAESADEDEAPPPITALGVQPDLPKPPLGSQSGPSKSSTTTTPAPPPQSSSPTSSDYAGADPEPSPWMPGTTTQEAHVK